MRDKDKRFSTRHIRGMTRCRSLCLLTLAAMLYVVSLTLDFANAGCRYDEPPQPPAKGWQTTDGCVAPAAL